MKQFKTIGYYICEVEETPKWIQGSGRKILSVSGCIGQQHPRWECFFAGKWGECENQEYQNKLSLNREQYREFLETANSLFRTGRMDIDSRFLHLSDAQNFYRKFCQAAACRVVSVSTTVEYYKILSEELCDGNSSRLPNGENDNGSWIGSDILGWDISGFHSFLCNSLQKDLPAARFNDISLLGNDFEEVVDFARRIAGRGEPVEWIPCRIGAYE